MQNVAKAGKPAASGQNTNQTLVIVIIVIAVVAAAAFMLVAINSTRASFDQAFFDAIPEERLADGGFVLGDPEAPVTIVEFADWYCPACQSYKPTMDQLIRDYVATGKARYEYRVLMTAGASANPNTYYLSQLVECAAQNEVSYFYANEIMYELIMSGQGGANVGRTFADRVGVPFATIVRCAQEADQHTLDARLASSVGASSTPTIMYRANGGQPLPINDRSITALGTLIDSLQ